MNRLLRADMYRMYHNGRFYLFAGAMLALAVMFVVMQYTAMDYVVSLDRVIFLPMSFYGVVLAALVSLFVGDDFSDGVIRNKLIAGRTRSAVYLSNMITVWTASLGLYLTMLLITVGVGIHMFENTVTGNMFMEYLGLGILICFAMGSICCMVSMWIGNKANAVMVCMGLAFAGLFLCLHTNQVLMQKEYKNGMLNPHFIDGVQRMIYEFLHDINPMGQAAQLSSMECLHPVRWICCDIVWIFATLVVGIFLFKRKDIK